MKQRPTPIRVREFFLHGITYTLGQNVLTYC